MLIENLTYLVTFIITAGIAVIGVLSAFGLHQEHNKSVLQILFYQQVFLFIFFIYGIWGDIAIQEIISDLNLNNKLSNKLSLFIPVLGTPFLIVSWFMLLKFEYYLNGYTIKKKAVYAYFIAFFTLLFGFAFFIQYQIITLPSQPELFIIRILLLINLGIHLLLFFPILKQRDSVPVPLKTNLFKQSFFGYFVGVVLYSASLFFYNYFGFIFTCLSILLVFGISAILPVSIRYTIELPSKKLSNLNANFKQFCEQYEISKREAEIILEICSGKTNKAISEKLFITLQTVKDHNHRIFTKTQVKTRVQLTNLVHEQTGLTNV